MGKDYSTELGFIAVMGVLVFVLLLMLFLRLDTATESLLRIEATLASEKEADE